MNPNSEIVALGKTDQSKPLIIRNRVFDSLLTTDELTDFTRPKYHLLQLLRREVPVEDIAVKLGIPQEDVIAFRDSPKAQEYLRDRELAAILAQEAKDEDRWWLRAEAVLSGKLAMSKGQTEAFKEVGKRVAPITESHGASTTKIEINIDPEAIERARAKKKAIEAELVS